MKYKQIAFPKPSKGLKNTSKRLVVPNQAMGLQEILERFTRNEPLPIGKDVNYHESDDDLMKVSRMDLVDRQEYVEKLKETKKAYDKQEQAKAKKQREKLEAEEREKIRLQELEKLNAAKSGKSAD